jgi:heme-degrading monooxygenase HmoA
MFARIFRVGLKPQQADAYTRAVEQKVVPILQRFKGFRDETTMMSTDRTEVIAITFWDRQEDLEAYERAAYDDVYKVLEPFLAGTPEIHGYPVVTSTAMAAYK